ncbi:hypothetical protein ZOSMA_1G01670 [Zostera marina]|uniref:Uncharacterized protein n=1 Tax=Zostera marina TaxID=29655 RepID=A0A0K9PPP6_ZOSMR|nr:hypothetical protein ZOSMA_1G01670 [Zostera marina]
MEIFCIITRRFNQNLGWIEIPMRNLIGVEILHSSTYLNHQIDGHRKREDMSTARTCLLLDVTTEIFVHEFHQKKALFFTLVGESTEDVDYVWM